MIKKNFLIYNIVEISICIFFWINTNYLREVNYSINNIEVTIGIFSIINLSIFLIFYNNIKKEIFTVSVLFNIFLYLFNLGTPVSRLFGWINKTDQLVLIRRVYSMGLDNVINYYIFAYLLISFLQIGILYSSSKCMPSKNKETSNLTLKSCKKFGIILLSIGIIPFMISETLFLRHSLQYVYQDAKNILDLSGTGLGLIGGFFTIGLIMIMYGNQDNSKKFDFYLICFSFYHLIRMFITGDRSTGIIIILILFLMRHKLVSRINKKKMIVYIIAVIIMLTFIKAIELTRSKKNVNFLDTFEEVLHDNPIGDTLKGFGNNVWSGMMVYYSVPRYGTYRLGRTYVEAIIGKPIELLGITDKIWNNAFFSNFLIHDTNDSLIKTLTSAMGGSFTGEAYFNFGWTSIIIALFFGYWLEKFSDNCFLKDNNPIYSCYLIYISTLIIWWVRQYFASVSWCSIFYGITIYFIYKIFILHSVNKYNNINNLNEEKNFEE